MIEQMFALKITVIGEVRDADGNLLESQPIEIVNQEFTEAQLRAEGLTDEQIRQIKERV
jgi:hypothetical protein